MQSVQPRRDRRTFAISLGAVVFLTFGYFADGVHAAAMEVRLRIEQNWAANGSVDYTFTPLGLAGTTIFTPVVREPNGNVIPANVPIEHLSFSDIQSRFFGAWSIQDGTPTPNYTFSYGSFGLGDVFSEQPLVTSPIDGATLKPGFQLNWHYASGVVTPNDLRLYLDTNGLGTHVASFLQPQSWEIDDNMIDRVTHLPLTQDVVTLRVGRDTALDSFVSALTLIGTPGSNNLSASSFFRDGSAPVTVTIVPEPGTVVLFASAFAMLVGLRFSRRRSR